MGPNGFQMAMPSTQKKCHVCYEWLIVLKIEEFFFIQNSGRPINPSDPCIDE